MIGRSVQTRLLAKFRLYRRWKRRGKTMNYMNLPYHDTTPYSSYPSFSQLPYSIHTAHLATVLPTTTTSPTLTHRCGISLLKPGYPLRFPSRHPPHAESPCITLFSHCCSQALATAIIAKPQGCQRRFSSLRRSFSSLLGPSDPQEGLTAHHNQPYS